MLHSSISFAVVLGLFPLEFTRAEPLASLESDPLPAGLERVTVLRTKKLHEALAGSRLSPEVLMIPMISGINEALKPLPNVSPGEISSTVSAAGSGGAKFTLISLAAGCSMDEFVKKLDSSRAALPGDGSCREATAPSGDRSVTRGVRRFSAQEYLLYEYGEPCPVTLPGKVLSELRSSVAGSGMLVWHAAAGTTRLPGTAPALSGLRLSLSCPDQLHLRAVGSLPDGTDAAKTLAALEPLLPPIKRYPKVTESDQPVRRLTSAGSSIRLEASFPMPTLMLSLPSFLTGLLHPERREYPVARTKPVTRPRSPAPKPAVAPAEVTVADSDALLEDPDAPENRRRGVLPFRRAASAEPVRARRIARTLAASFASALEAGATKLSRADSVRAAVESMMNGVTGSGEFSSLQFRVSLDPGDAEQAMAYLKWDSDGPANMEYVPAKAGPP